MLGAMAPTMMIGSINVFSGGGFEGIIHRIDSIGASGGAMEVCGD